MLFSLMFDLECVPINIPILKPLELFRFLMDLVFKTLNGKGHRLFSTRIDEQLQLLISRPLIASFESICPGFGEKVKLECQTIVEAVYFMLTLFKNQPTPGMQAVNLAVSEKNIQSNSNISSGLGVAYIIAKYATLKLQSISALENWREKSDTDIRKKAYRSLQIVVGAAKLISLLHMVVFLWQGEFPNVLYRLLNCNTSLTKDGPGYSQAQQFMESKKMLWYAVLGLATAASITVDWRAIKCYLYFSGRTVLNLINSSAFGVKIREYARRARSTAARVSTAIMSLYLKSHGINSRAVTASCVDEGNDANYIGNNSEDEEEVRVEFSDIYTGGSTSAKNSISGSNEMRNIFSRVSKRSGNGEMSTAAMSVPVPAVTVDLTCTACRENPAEMPHVSDCNHVFCYICLQTLMGDGDSASGGNIGAGNEEEVAQCPACFKRLKTCIAWTPQTQ